MREPQVNWPLPDNQHVMIELTGPNLSLGLPHFILAEHHNIKSFTLSTQLPQHPGRISFGSSVDWRPRSLEGRRSLRFGRRPKSRLRCPWISKVSYWTYRWYQNYIRLWSLLWCFGDLMTSFGHLQEFFFEHHIENKLMHRFWKHDVNGSFQDSSLVAAGSCWGFDVLHSCWCIPSNNLQQFM